MQVCRCGGEDLNSKCDLTHLTVMEPSNMVEVRKAAEHAAAAEGRENMPKPSMEKETVFAVWETSFGKRTRVHVGDSGRVERGGGREYPTPLLGRPVRISVCPARRPSKRACGCANPSSSQVVWRTCGCRTSCDFFPNPPIPCARVSRCVRRVRFVCSLCEYSASTVCPGQSSGACVNSVRDTLDNQGVTRCRYLVTS